MDLRKLKAIDCDIHPAVPGMRALMPYLSDHWREQVKLRGMHELDSISYPAGAPLTCRPDWRPADGAKPGSSLPLMQEHALDRFGLSLAICNCLYGVQVLFSEDMGAGFATAVNRWLVAEWLDKDTRLRGSIVVPAQNPDLAVEEIERCAGDKRFVQVMMLVLGDMPLGKRFYWPIYKAAEKHGLPIGIHAGSAYRHPVTSVGWVSHYSEDYAAQAAAFQTQLTSLICEGVFSKFPALTVVLLESGVSWLPAQLWRLTKYWRGLRPEIPWVDRSPSEIVRSNVRLSMQPIDAPEGAHELARLMEHFESDDLLLFSTDYPHWQFDGDAVLPAGLSDALIHKICRDNPLATYPRLRETI